MGRIGHGAKRKAEKNIEEEINLFRVRFENAMDDDFNTADALAVLFEMVTFINKKLLFLTEGSDLGNAGVVLMELGKVFGLFEISAKKKIDKDLSEGKIKDLIEQRNKARKNKDFNAADGIRKDLEAKGIILEDTKQGTIWRVK